MDIPGHLQQHVPTGNYSSLSGVWSWKVKIICFKNHVSLSLCPETVCHVLSGALLQSSKRGTESNQTSGQISLRQNGGFCLFLVRQH